MHAQLAPVEQVIGHEIHAPDLIDLLRLCLGLSQLRRLVSFKPLVAQRQAMLPVQAVDPLVIVLDALAPEQHVYRSVAVVHTCLRGSL